MNMKISFVLALCLIGHLTYKEAEATDSVCLGGSIAGMCCVAALFACAFADDRETSKKFSGEEVTVDVDVVLERLKKEVAIYQASGNTEELDKKQKLISVSNVTEEKCDPESLFDIYELIKIYSTFTEDYRPYLKQLSNEQAELCSKLIGSQFQQAAERLPEDVRLEAQQLQEHVYNSTKFRHVSNLHLFVPNGSIVKGVASFVGDKWVVGTTKDKKKVTFAQFKDKYDATVGQLCSAINEELRESMDKFKSIQKFIGPGDKSTKEWITAERVCESLAMDADIVNKAYKKWLKK